MSANKRRANEACDKNYGYRQSPKLGIFNKRPKIVKELNLTTIDEVEKSDDSNSNFQNGRNYQSDFNNNCPFDIGNNLFDGESLRTQSENECFVNQERNSQFSAYWKLVFPTENLGNNFTLSNCLKNKKKTDVLFADLESGKEINSDESLDDSSSVYFDWNKDTEEIKFSIRLSDKSQIRHKFYCKIPNCEKPFERNGEKVSIHFKDDYFTLEENFADSLEKDNLNMYKINNSSFDSLNWESSLNKNIIPEKNDEEKEKFTRVEPVPKQEEISKNNFEMTTKLIPLNEIIQIGDLTNDIPESTTANNFPITPVHGIIQETTENYLKENPLINHIPESQLDYFYTIKISLNINNSKNFEFSNLRVKEEDLISHVIKISKNSLELINRKELRILIHIAIKKQYYNYSSPYIGIINEGTTCYLNSMLQTLNILTYFKDAVYKMPSEGVAYSLQKVFYDLMTQKSAISIKCLLESFGWNRQEMNIQRDIQEFNILLSELLEGKMKGTKAEGTFPFLFRGRVSSNIKCLHVNYTSTKEEEFSDLQLTVKNCNNIYESFDKYTEEEILDNENKYHTDEFGKQKAKKQIEFVNFPNVLILLLKRFDFDVVRNSMEKVNDYFEFYEKINLEKYVKSKNSEKEEFNFTLHSVIVHSGSSTENGHYYAFIKPGTSKNWFKFDDGNVRRVELCDVFENNFGGDSTSYRPNSGFFSTNNFGNILEYTTQSESNAYVLVYIKDSQRDKILSLFTVDDLPRHIKNRIENEKREEERIKLKQLREFNYFNLSFITKEVVYYLRDKIGLGLFPTNEDLDLLNLDSLKYVLNVPKNLTTRGLIKMLAAVCNVPENYIHVYLFKNCKDQENLFLRHKYEFTKITNLKLDCPIFNLKFSFHHLFIDIFPFESDSCMKNFNNFSTRENTYSILKLNDDLIHPQVEQVYSLNNNDMIFYTNKFWSLCVNNINLSFGSQVKKNEFSIFDEIIDEPVMNQHSSKDNLICFVKYLKIEKSPESFVYKNKLVIGDIISMSKSTKLSELKEKLNIKERYKQFLPANLYSQIFSQEVNVNFRNESKINFTSKKQEYLLDDKLDLDLSLIGDSVCLIADLNWVEEFEYGEKKLKSLTLLINEAIHDILFNLNFSFYLNQNKKFTKIKTEKLLISDLNEEKIKNYIHSNLGEFYKLNQRKNVNYLILPENGDQHSLISYQDYLNMNKELICIKNCSTNNFQFNHLPSKSVFNQNSSISNIVNYSTSEDYSITNRRIDFFISDLPKSIIGSHYFLKILLSNIDSNPIVQLGLILPRNLKSNHQILNYLHSQRIIDYFYTNQELLSFNVIAQHPTLLMVRNLFLSHEERSFNMVDMYNNVEYRIQPFLANEISQINKFVFLTICLKGVPFHDPIVLPISDDEMSVGEVKVKLIKKILKLNLATDSLFDCLFDRQQTIFYEFYVCYLVNSNLNKGELLDSSKNDSKIKNYFISKILSLLVELPYIEGPYVDMVSPGDHHNE